MNGFVKLSRKILESAVFSDADILRLWIYILCRVAYKANDVICEGSLVHLERGQLITGRKKLALALEISEKSAYTQLKKLEKLGCVSIESKNKYSVVTVVNWDKYQLEEEVDVPTSEESQKDDKETTNGQQTECKETTKGQQKDTNEEREEIKEREEREEVKKTDEREVHGLYRNVFLTKEEYNTLKRDFWEVDSKIDKLSAYIMKTGHNYPSHCTTLRSWLEKDGMKRNKGFDGDFDPDEYFREALRKSMEHDMK